MTTGPAKRHYLAFKIDEPEAASPKLETNLEADVKRWLQGLIGKSGGRSVGVPFDPRSRWTFSSADAAKVSSPRGDVKLITGNFHPTELADAKRALGHAQPKAGIDLALHRTDYWSPTEAQQPLFGTRDDAHRLMGIPADPKPCSNQVNVVIVDQGLNQEIIAEAGGIFAGGWHRDRSRKHPGQTRPGHGSMLARNIIKTAPGARIFDLPLIPADINDAPAFLSDAHAAYESMLDTIGKLRREGFEGSWIIVNAWAVYNRGQEHRLSGDDHSALAFNYSANLEHAFNEVVGAAVEQGLDLVFAAGNCGQFCPMARCGAGDIGPGRSISGANAHPSVLTVGAVRTDGLWLGYSSQGPDTFGKEKPDLCAASQFSENDDAGASNTGTSAACALVAGVLARLRSSWSADVVPPDVMKSILIETASKGTGHARWDRQLGHGIIHATRAWEEARSRAAASKRPGG